MGPCFRKFIGPPWNQNCCHQMRFPGSKYTKNAFAAGAVPRTPHAELRALPQIPSWIWDHIAAGGERYGRKGEVRDGEDSERGGERPLKLRIPGSFFLPSPPLSSSNLKKSVTCPHVPVFHTFWTLLLTKMANCVGVEQHVTDFPDCAGLCAPKTLLML